MEQYIPKSALVAVIDKFMYGANLEADIASTGECFNEEGADAKYQLCKQIKDTINTLEVKEVEKENLTPNDISIIWTIIIGLIEELKFRINKWPGEKLFEEALKRFKVQKEKR